MQDREVNKIYETIDYNKFHFINGNRATSEEHVNKIVTSMKKKVLLIPIHVDETFGIIDGQHRFKAYKQLNQPVPYIITDKCSIYDIADMNIGNPWKDIDYIHFYSEQGNSNYKSIMNLRGICPFLKFTKLYIAIASGSPKSINNKKIKDGSFKFNDWFKAKATCDTLMDFEQCSKKDGKRKKNSPWGHYYFFLSLYKLICMPSYDHKLMIKKIEKYPDFIVKQVDVKSYLSNLFELYNRNNANKLSLDLIK